MKTEILKVVGKFLGRTAIQLLTIGSYSAMNQYTHEQLRKHNTVLIGEISRGIEHQVKKINIIVKR